MDHSLRRRVQPTSGSLFEIAFDSSNRAFAAQMDVRGLSAHGLQQFELIMTLWQHGQFNPAAIRSQAPYDPLLAQIQKRIRTPDRLLNDSVVMRARIFSGIEPDAGRGRHSLCLAGDLPTVPLRQCHKSLAAQTAQT